MTPSDYTFVSEELDHLREKHCEGVSRICAAFMRAVHRDWSKEFPKRKLRLVEGMGSIFWTIDGRHVYGLSLARRKNEDSPLGVCYYAISHPRLERMLKPLNDAIIWYCEYSDYRVAVAIGDIE